MRDASKKGKAKKRGRPATGHDPLVALRISETLIEQIDEWVKPTGRNRSEAIRLWIENGLLDKPPRGWFKK